MTGLGSVLKRLFVCSILLVPLLVATTATPAWAAPAFSAPTPAPGSTIALASAQVAMPVTDTVALSSAPTMTVDGNAVGCWIEYFDTGGTWYDDGCESWYEPAYDYTRGTIRANLSGLANGSHTLAVRETDSAGGAQTYSWSFNVSSIPLLSAPSPANGAWVASLGPTVTANVAANAAVASCSLTIDGITASASYDATTKKISGVPLANLAGGVTHTAVARVTDAFGLTGSLTWTFGTSVTGPAIGGQTPASGALLTAPATAISFAASDPSSFNAVSLKLDGVAVPVSWNYVDLGGTWYDDGCEGWYEPAYDYTRITAVYSAAALKDGTHTVVAQTTGRTGLSSTSTWSFGVSTAPVIDSATPANGAYSVTLQPAISARITDNGTIASSSMSVDGVAVAATYNATTKTLSYVPSAPLTDNAEHTVLVTATDDVGNTGQSQWTFRTKSSAPVLGGALPAPGSATAAYRPGISVSVSDGTQLSTTPSMSVDGVKVACSFAYVDTGGSWYDDGYDSWYEPAYDYTRGTISYTPPADLANGTHTVKVEEANTLGVKGSYAWEFTVTAPPVLSSPVPASGASVGTLSPAISIAVKTNAGVAAAAATVDGVSTPAVWDATAKVVRIVPIAPLLDNSAHAVAATVTDTAGQAASYTWAFNTDVTGPTIGAVTPSAGSTLSVNSARISVAASDAAGMGTVHTMRIDGVTVPASWAYVEISGQWVGTGCDAQYIADYDYTSGSLAYQATALSDGQHTVAVTVANASGMTATKTWTFTVAVPPQITVPVPGFGAVVPSLTPTISAKVTDNGTLASTRMTLDGATIASSYDAVSKTLTALPAAALTDDAAHSVVVYATDAAGGSSSLSWSFRTHTASPTLSNASPATSTAVWDPVVSIEGADAAGLKTTATMRIDGAVVPATVTFVDLGGSWYDDGCESWYEPAYDYTRGTVTYQPAKLADGVHTASVEIANAAGTTSSRSWSFEVKAPPKLSDPKPNVDSKLSTQTPEISVALAENSTIATVSAVLDGAAVPASYDAATGRVSVSPGRLLANDVDHAVTVRATDGAGYSAELSWKFHIQIYMSMASSMGCGDCHTSVGHVTTNCTPCHGSDCSGSGCHGSGHGILYFPPEQCAGCHPGNGIGHGDVTDAHDSSRDMTSCRPCHVLSLTTEHGRRMDASGAAMTCASCHESADTKVTAAIAAGSSDCAACHDMGAPSGAGHLDQHAEVPLSAECLTCHQPNIVTEHLSNTKTQDTTLTCDTCHASADAGVQAAIASGTTDCAACHSTTHGDLAVVHTPADVDSVSCAGDGCHGDGNALRLHAGRAEGECAVCHANPTRGDLTAGKTTAGCGGCHTTSGVDYHLNMAVHITTPASYETCGHCHHAWGSNPLKGPDVTRHAAGCRTCHNATIDTASLTTECGSCHKVEGTDYHQQTVVVHTATTAGSTDCARCHETTNVQDLHAEVGCDACHATYACGECHSMHMGMSSGGLLAGVECSRCHATAGTDYHRSLDASHTFSAMSSSCAGSSCHTADLRTTHASLVGTGSPNPQYPDTCALCHLNDDPARIPADATADCTSCHTLHGDMATIHAARGLPGEVSLFGPDLHGGVGFAVDCGLCHEVANVAVIHGNTCSTCHPSPRDSFTTWTGACQQAGCHATYHDAAHAGHAAVYSGCGCHNDTDYTVGAADCGRCHTLIDHQPPATTSDAKSSYVGPATIRLTASDLPPQGGSGVAGTFYMLDGGAVTTGTTVVVAQPSTGSAGHVLSFWSSDRKGNVEPTKTVSFTVAADTSPPVTTSDLRTSYFGPAAIRLTATDNGSTAPTTYYSLDAAQPAAGTTVNVAQPAAGSATHTLEFWSVDAAGNAENRHSGTFTIAVDGTPPVTTCDLKAAYKVGDRTRINLTATDTGSGVGQTYYSRDGVNALAGTYFFPDSASPGTKSIWYWAVDNVGNVEQRHVATYIIDGAAPVTTSDAVPSYTGPARIRLAASDGASGSGVAATYFRLDGAGAVAATETTVYAAGPHTLEFWSVDAVGYVETHKTVTFTIQGAETVAPVTTSDAQASYVASAAIHLTAADEGGSGVAATYWTLNGGARNTGTSISVNTPGTYNLEYWSVDGAGNEESPHKTTVFTVEFPANTGLVRFIWANPPAGAWTYYYVYVYDSSNRLVGTAYNENGCWDVYVPVSTTPYQLKAYWYDPLDPGYPVMSEQTILMDTSKIVPWYY